ncbi:RABCONNECTIN-3A [Salix viminalis]|uniref:RABCONNECTIN-3A n=1 Tax=Salix viminalis TaxID=40686 RepID=A0A9Q0UGV0_SALVM|nr:RABCONNECTIN-3A [Salix viminalis]
MPETSTASPTQAPINPTDHLPLSLFRSDTIPPAPTRSASTIDWLPDFSGYSWVAYGASSLLVISHLPSPLSPEETAIGPILRQVFELSGDESSPVNAVSWSPVNPSIGELAAASDNFISVFSHDSASSRGSFCWSQNAMLVQSTKVGAIAWTGSGDGIVSGGIDVVLWRRRNMSWEIAWKFKRDQPQNLVSATWSIEGPSASAAYPSKVDVKGSDQTSNCVLVGYGGNGTSEYVKTELHHPQPVSKIQWRPSAGQQARRDKKHLRRHVLLTCCLDGTLRLWTEVDSGKVRKLGKDSHDHKTVRKSFCIAAVIEIKQVLKGTLGMDVFFSWATEIGGIYRIGEGIGQTFSVEGNEHDRVGRCEWLIGFGPGRVITFWAIHCLDDISPIRFPRVTLWKTQELKDLEAGHLHGAGFANLNSWLLLDKVVVMRNCLSGPPNICCLMHLSPCNFMVTSLLYSQISSNIEDESFSKSKIDKYSSCSSAGLLNGGHTGKILQVAMHPHIYEVELAVSLDSDGLLLFWIVSTISNCSLGPAKLIPRWKLSGKLATYDSCSKYTSLRWAPSTLGEDHVLLVGHAGGIDCFIVKISQICKEGIICHYIGTIPLTGHGPYEDGPTNIFAVPLPSSCNKTFRNNRFLLLAIWLKGFQPISWEVTLHSFDLSGRCCDCKFDDKNTSVLNFENTFADRRYCVGVDPCSSQLPEPYCHDQITSFSVVCPGDFISMPESLGSDKDLCSGVPAYVMATGCSDGSMKLWRSNSSKQLTPQIPWELVGTQLDDTSILHVWEAVHVIGAGSFILEDRLAVGRDAISLNWLTLGNGQLFLGICMHNELQVYAQKHHGGQTLLSPQSLNVNSWSCIAVSHTFPAISDFLWGPNATAIVVHDSLVVAIAQLKHYSNAVQGLWSLVELAEKLRGTLAVYHPEALIMNIYSGNWKRAYVSVRHLVEYLASGCAAEKRYNSADHSKIVPQILLSKYFEGFLLKDSGSTNKGFQWNADARLPTSSSQFFAYNFTSDASNNMFAASSTKSELSAFAETLEKYDFESLTNLEKSEMLAIIDLLSDVQHSACAYANLDEPGRRFWVSLRFQQLHFFRRFGRSPSVEELVGDSRLMSWALHSDCQENLFCYFLPNEPSWKEMQTLGVGFWFTNVAQLRTRMEKLARLQYLRKKDPKDSALLYIVLNRLPVLSGLFKISKDEKDKPLVAFLSRNFQEEKNKAAALKNAYVLMGRHQLELAIAFFLLGGDTYSAITICAKNFGDEQLALIICRLIEGRGGPLEHHLITKFILPSASERGDYWLTSLLEWELGNYSQSFLSMLGLQASSMTDNMRNAAGEQSAAILGRWATIMAATAFNRRGLPCVLPFCYQCFCSSYHFPCRHEKTKQKAVKGSVSDVDQSQILHGILNPFASESCNWLSGDVALCLQSHGKLDLALQYFSKLMSEHPSWLNTIVGSVQPGTSSKDCEIHQHEKLVKEFREKLYTGLSIFEQKFLVVPSCVIKMILVWSCSNGLPFIGHDIIVDYTSRNHSQDKSNSVGNLILYKPCLKSMEDASLLLSRFITLCSVTCLQPQPFYIEGTMSVEVKSIWSDVHGFYFQGIIQTLWSLRAALRIFSISEDVTRSLVILDLFEYYIYFALAWLQRNSKGLLLMVQPLLITLTSGHTPYEVDIGNLKSILHQIAELPFSLSIDDAGSGCEVIKCPLLEQNGQTMLSFSEDEKWHIVGACLWIHMSRFMKHQLHLLSIKLEDGCFSGVSHGTVSSLASSSTIFGSDSSSRKEEIGFCSLMLAKLLRTTLVHVSSYHVKLLGLFLQQEVENRLELPTLVWMKESSLSQAKALYQDVSADMMNSKDELSSNGRAFLSSWQKDAVTTKEVSHFQNAKVVHKRDGELLEALCINSIDERQAALASNRKGIVFFSWEDGIPFGDQSEYIWSDADWPPNGWAGAESTPIPTCVSPGVGLGSKKGAHLGLGGATIGVGALARQKRNLTGNGAFGVPGYAGIGASGLGWEVQEDFEEFVDPLATVENISTRAFSSHPSRPFFLAGSSNTHIYLWEFGKEKATATYGVLPAANVPPPYALASISSLQFDHYGHRFATAALDGTVCTWQLEVGGRSNIHPTESCLCLHGHASDVTYITSSGSVIAATGYSSNGANVVIWDTLAPPTTSRASIVCHEGGARSISVFDNDIGSGSISPLIVTGGKGGDVGLHDFRYIATGRTKRHNMNNNSPSNIDTQTGDGHQLGGQNRNGMLWYMPKAHLGSVTKISTIPHTSLFLTGSKDGDVKLWDAKAAKLVLPLAKIA